MRYKLLIIVIMTVSLTYITWPKENQDTYHSDYEIPKSFEVVLDGAIVYPGTYNFYMPLSIHTLIDYAGGLEYDADLTTINMNEVVSTNIKIYIPKKEVTTIVKLNINTASYEEMLKVEGITPRIAEQILVTRNIKGYFKTLDELIDVKYIGTATLEKIRPYLTV